MTNKVKESEKKIDKTWAQLEEKYGILAAIERDGYYYISANVIKEFQEPRLAVKFDHAEDRPQLFQTHKLSILPITRGDYIISKINAYHEFNIAKTSINFKDTFKTVHKSVPKYIKSLTANSITSEAKAINIAYISGILADFLGEEGLLPTVSGRMSSGTFSFQACIADTEMLTNPIEVVNSQIEIDAAYEGPYSLSLVEAKMDLAENFLVRQLYYPFRTWQKVMNGKPVRPIFLIYSNSIFYLYEFSFSKLDNYNSVELVNFKKYTLEDNFISKADIEKVVRGTTIKPNPKLQFPQANSFDRIINLCEQLYLANEDREAMSERYNFHSRQAAYYSDAARYLGLVIPTSDKKGSFYQLTEEGKSLWKLPYKERQLQFVKAMASLRVFRESIEYYLDTDSVPNTEMIVQFMVEAEISYSASTMRRRASTVRGWVQWLSDLIVEV